MRTIGVVTTSRADYGVYLPLLRRIQDDPDLDLHLIAGGMHLSPEFGLTAEAIEADGFQIDQRVELLLSSDTPEAIAKSMGLGTIGFAQAYARRRPDILLVLGDRFEMHAAAVAAVPFLIPIAHIAGGAVTAGAIDDTFRHSISKMSHLHFAETETYARRIIQMGEDPRRVHVTGALALDHILGLPPRSDREGPAQNGIPTDQPPLLVTFHPVTLEHEQTEWQMGELLAALNDFEAPILFTYPNADTNGRLIIRMIQDFASHNKRAIVLKNLGQKGYFDVMQHAVAMVGNSSSGIVEGPSFRLPVVNIGTRQKGRITADNVISVGYHRDEIVSGITEAVSEDFRLKLQDLVNPYGDGHAAERIIHIIKTVALGDSLLKKEFYDQSSNALVPKRGTPG